IDDVANWKSDAIDTVVSALIQEEITETDLQLLPDVCRKAGIKFISIPIPDRGTPTTRQAIITTLELLEQELENGKTIAVFCRQGLGRSPLIAAALLVLGGMSAEEAFKRISDARGCRVPETTEQEEWVRRLEADIL